MGPRMVSPSRVISAASCELILCEVGNDGTKALAVDRMRKRGTATRRRDVILELRLWRMRCDVTHEGCPVDGQSIRT